VAALAAGTLAWSGTAAAAPGTGGLQRDFAAAAREFHVPQGLLMAVAYQQSRWEGHDGLPSTTGNYGVMGLVHVDGAALRAAGARPQAPAYRTLDTAAALIGRSAAALRGDPRQNVRGGAALLARYERQLAGRLPADPGAWYGAVARFGQSPDAEGAAQYADRVYATLRAGMARTTADGRHVTLAANPSVAPRTSTLRALGLPHAAAEARAATRGGTAAFAPECPSGLACDVVPAAYRLNDPKDKASYGNYDLADRPADGNAIRYIVVHDTEGGYAGSLASFQDSASLAAPHYLVRSSDGLVTQLVPTRDIAWHAGNYYVNTHAIGIEHEGFAISGASWYTESLYESSAALVRYLAARFGVPLDRAHVIGHDDVPAPQPAQLPGMHWDPGPYWDWAHYLDLLGAAPAGSRTPVVGRPITIDPPFTRANEPQVTGCGTKVCRSQPANFVPLRAAPSPTAPLIGDPVMASHQGADGTTDAADLTDKAEAGQTFVVAAVQGDWTAIWYGGREAWFADPGGTNAVVPAGSGLTVTPAGDSAVPVYGRAYPEASAYPAVLAPVAAKSTQAVVPLGYTIPAGQHYMASAPVAADYFYARNIDQSAPGDDTRVVGSAMYYPIRFNHRLGFVKASDVAVRALP
jgi:hypothetical protein